MIAMSPQSGNLAHQCHARIDNFTMTVPKHSSGNTKSPKRPPVLGSWTLGEESCGGSSRVLQGS